MSGGSASEVLPAAVSQFESSICVCQEEPAILTEVCSKDCSEASRFGRT